MRHEALPIAWNPVSERAALPFKTSGLTCRRHDVLYAAGADNGDMTGEKQPVAPEKIELCGILARLRPLALGNSAARLKPFLVESETTAFHVSMRPLP